MAHFMYHGKRVHSLLLITDSCKENWWIHAFPKAISMNWNADSIVQELISIHLDHFVRR